MIKSCNMNERDEARLSELKKFLEVSTTSDVIRLAIRELHKKFFAAAPSIDGNGK